METVKQSYVAQFAGLDPLLVIIMCGDGLVTKLCLTLVTPWTAACQAPLSMGFSRQEYWSGLSCSPLGALSDLGIEHTPHAFQAASCIACESMLSLKLAVFLF